MIPVELTYDKSKIAVAKHENKPDFFCVNLISHPHNKYDVSKDNLQEFLIQLEGFLDKRENN